MRMIPSETWRGGSADEINGVRVRAFTPWGAGHVAWKRGLISGLKNFEVLLDGKAYRPFYPGSPSFLSLLDAPTWTRYILRQIWLNRA